MNAEFIAALGDIERERGISKDILIAYTAQLQQECCQYAGAILACRTVKQDCMSRFPCISYMAKCCTYRLRYGSHHIHIIQLHTVKKSLLSLLIQ